MHQLQLNTTTVHDLRFTSSPDVYPDAAPLLAGELGQVEREHAVLVVSRDARAVYGVGQAEGADEAALRSLGAAHTHALLRRPLAADDEPAVVEAHVQALAVDAGQVEREQVLAFVLVDVRRRYPVGALDLALVLARARAALRRLLEQAVHALLQAEEVAHGVEPVSRHCNLQRNDECGMMN